MTERPTSADEHRRIGWTQPLCDPCFAAWTLGRGEPPRQPTRVRGVDGDPCLVCGAQTTIYARIDPKLAEHFQHAKLRDD
jgi:hypothetical protein